MANQSQGESFRGGEAGHQGHDRQPGTAGAKVDKNGTPDEKAAATPGEVAARSKEAIQTQSQRGATPDIAHPGPDRLEGEKSKGDLHHNQHEQEKDMQDKVEEL